MADTTSLRILVIDDDAIMTELLSAVLGMHGHTVLTADSGEAGLALLAAQDSSQPFDVVLTDLQLPGLRGHALATALRSKITSSTRLMGMSGSPPSHHERSAFDAFLLKPFNADQFTAAAAGASLPAAPSLEVPETGLQVLDEAIVARLAKQLPAAKLKELYQLTLADSRMRLELIQKAMDYSDLDTVRREAHAIKGGAGMVGASELHLLAAQAETAAGAGSAADTPAVADFLAACNRLESMLDTRFS
jgi:CheY-like chemotaxis protein